jgi:hypothetical protein
LVKPMGRARMAHENKGETILRRESKKLPSPLCGG